MMNLVPHKLVTLQSFYSCLIQKCNSIGHKINCLCLVTSSCCLRPLATNRELCLWNPCYFSHSFSSWWWGSAFSSFWVTVLNVTLFSSCAFELVVLNWIQVLQVWLLLVFWKFCWSLRSSVVCFGAQSIQDWWMPKVQTLGNCLLLWGNSEQGTAAVHLLLYTWNHLTDESLTGIK